MKRFNAQLDSRLLARARQLEHLTMLLRNVLPPECDNHFHVAGIHDKTLVIVTDSPVWTTRLRQLSPLILNTLTANSQNPLQHVRIISRHGPVVSNYEPAVVKREISQQTSRHIAQTASYIEDEKLQAALLKISRHGSKE